MAIDLFCGLGGWTEGLLAEGFECVGFDIEQHQYGAHRYPAQLVVQDVLTLHGSQFRDAALIVASPPCQAYSYRAMPWKRAKALPPPDNTLFEACFRIQREASIAAGRHIPLIVENVRGAQPWVGRARWNFGSFYLWGDVPALMPFTANRIMKYGKICHSPEDWARVRSGEKIRHPHAIDGSGRSFRSASVEETGKKGTGSWFGDYGDYKENAHIKCDGDWLNAEQPSISRLTSSKSSARKQASAMIAKIPLPLSRHIARVYAP